MFILSSENVSTGNTGKKRKSDPIWKRQKSLRTNWQPRWTNITLQLSKPTILNSGKYLFSTIFNFSVLCLLLICLNTFFVLFFYRKLEQDHKEKLTAVRSELMIEMDRIQQQAGLQREELEAEMGRIREDESFLRDHLSISVKVPEEDILFSV